MAFPRRRHRALWLGLTCATAAGHADPTPPASPSLLFIDNGHLRVGVQSEWGAGIAWISESGSSRNLVNNFDHGRLIQQSYYGAEDGSLWNGKPWRWNPVQGGDWRGHPATVLELRSGKDWIQARSRARHWASGAELPEVQFEERIELDQRFLHVRFTLRYSGTNTHPACHQEIPAIFVAPELDTLVFYGGPQPWSGGPLERHRPGWPNEYRRLGEPWAAYVGPDGRGLGAYVPIARELTCYRYGSGAKDPSACSYMAPITTFSLTPGMKFAYNLWITLGTPEEIRAAFLRKAKSQASQDAKAQ